MSGPPDVLVTGATGFIGSRLARLLVDDPDTGTVRCLVRREGAAAALPPGAEARRGDLLRPESLKEAVEGMAIVYHLAKVLPASREPEGAANLLRAAAAAGAMRRFVLVSSITVHADRPFLSGPGTKERQEAVARREIGDPSRLTILRPAQVYGPGCRDSLLARLARGAAAGAWYGGVGWPGRWNLIYVDDLARLIRAASRHPAAAGAAWNVGGPEPVAVAEILEAFHRAGGREAPLRRPPRPLAGGLALVASMLLRLRLLNLHLGWHAVSLLSDGWSFRAREPWERLELRPETDLEAGMRAWIAAGGPAA